jgi:hypothetical protein
MEMEATTANAEPTAGGVSADADGFGTRPSTSRPHSMRLDGGDVAAESGSGSRGLDVLLGVGIGAAAMFCLDPSTGSRRRARIRETTVSAATDWSGAARLAAVSLGAVLTLLGGRRRDAVGAAIGVLGSTLLAGAVKGGLPPAPADTSSRP